MQSSLDFDVFMRLPPDCGEISGKVVRFNRSLYALTQASRSWHNHLFTHMKSLGFEQRPADACLMRLVVSGSVSIVTVVHVDDVFTVGLEARYDRLCEDLNSLVPMNNPGELRWYAGCWLSRDWDAGTLRFRSWRSLTRPRRGLVLGLGGIIRFRLVSARSVRPEGTRG